MAGSKMPTCSSRSRPSRKIVIAITGVPRIKMMLVAYIAQINSGKRNHVKSRRAHLVNRDDEIQPGKNRRKSGNEYAQRRGNHAAYVSRLLLNGV